MAISNPPGAKKQPDADAAAAATAAPGQDSGGVVGGGGKEVFATPTFVPPRAVQKQGEDIPL